MRVPALADMYVRWRVRRSLDGIWISGLEHLAQASARGPVILAANHVCWWDGLVARMVDEAVAQDGRPIVAADSVRRVAVLRWIGALPLEPGVAAWAGLRRAMTHLSGPRRAVWIFPQGRQRPAAVRPLGFQGGLALLARRSGAVVLPVALDYPFRSVHLPAAAVAIGAPVHPNDAEARVTELLADIERWADGADGGFSPLVRSRVRAIDEGVGARLLAVRP